MFLYIWNWIQKAFCNKNFSSFRSIIHFVIYKQLYNYLEADSSSPTVNLLSLIYHVHFCRIWSWMNDKSSTVMMMEPRRQNTLKRPQPDASATTNVYVSVCVSLFGWGLSGRRRRRRPTRRNPKQSKLFRVTPRRALCHTRSAVHFTRLNNIRTWSASLDDQCNSRQQHRKTPCP